jgi:hypothetical protein
VAPQPNRPNVGPERRSMFRKQLAAKQNPTPGGQTTGGAAMALLRVLIVLVDVGVS